MELNNKISVTKIRYCSFSNILLELQHAYLISFRNQPFSFMNMISSIYSLSLLVLPTGHIFGFVHLFLIILFRKCNWCHLCHKPHTICTERKRCNMTVSMMMATEQPACLPHFVLVTNFTYNMCLPFWLSTLLSFSLFEYDLNKSPN